MNYISRPTNKIVHADLFFLLTADYVLLVGVIRGLVEPAITYTGFKSILLIFQTHLEGTVSQMFLLRA